MTFNDNKPSLFQKTGDQGQYTLLLVQKKGSQNDMYRKFSSKIVVVKSSILYSFVVYSRGSKTENARSNRL